MGISLHYGDGRVVVQVPEANVAGVICPRHLAAFGQSNTEILKEAISRSAGFTESIQGQTLGVLLPDGTRDLPLKDLFTLLFPLLLNAQKVVFYLCTGTHTADTPENQQIIELIRAEAGKVNLKDYEIVYAKGLIMG